MLNQIKVDIIKRKSNNVYSMEENPEKRWIEQGIADIEFYLNTDDIGEHAAMVAKIADEAIITLQENGIDIYIDSDLTIYDALQDVKNQINEIERLKRNQIIKGELVNYAQPYNDWQSLAQSNRQKKELQHRREMLSFVLELSESAVLHDRERFTQIFASIIVSYDIEQDDRVELLKLAHQYIGDFGIDLSMMDVMQTLRDYADNMNELKEIRFYFDRSAWSILNKIAQVVDQAGEEIMNHQVWNFFVEKIIERSILRYANFTYFDQIDDDIYDLADEIGIPAELVQELIKDVTE